MTTFKEHIALRVADVYDFVLLCDQAVSEHQTVLVPIIFCHAPLSQVLNQQGQSNPTIPIYQPDEKDNFLSGTRGPEAPLRYISAVCASGPQRLHGRCYCMCPRKFAYVS